MPINEALLWDIPEPSEDADRTRRKRRLDGRELALRQGEDDGNRLELGHDDKARRIGRMHDVALIDEPDDGPAGERRLDRRVVDLGLRAVDCCLTTGSVP
jgi:hypothetical protein